LYTDQEPLNYTFARLFYKVTTASGLHGDKVHPPTDIFFMMIQRPDDTGWVQLPFIIGDVGKSVEELRQEISDIQHEPELTKPKRLVLGMKEAIYYAFTGNPMDLMGLINDFYQVYNAK
jgi:hypothetical protein